MDQNQRLILAELEDRVEQIFAAIEELREVHGDGKSTRKLLDSIFRNVHSLKATALSNGLNDLSDISHQFENLLDSLRTGKAKLNDDVLDALEETAEALFAGLEDRSNSQSFTKLLNRLAQLTDTADRSHHLDVQIVLSTLPAEICASLSDAEKHRLEEAVSEGASLYLINTSFESTNFGQLFQVLRDRLTEKGEVISTAPRVDKDQRHKIDFRILYAREAALSQVKEELSGISQIAVNEIMGTSESADGWQSQELERQTSPAVLRSGQPATAKLIRINLDDLDRIIASTHKLFRKTTESLLRAIKLSDQSALTQLSNIADELHSSFMELAADLINLRMVPVDGVLQRALRAGRSAARVAGKEIDVVVRGRGLLLDKSLCDAITDPLIHLVRNAVDHGIEDAEQRAACGKNRRGTIRIEATAMQAQARIAVADDGRGIDPAIVADAAVRQSLLAKGSDINVGQSVRLLFRPGFSTAREVSGISGRGVGLDVVEKAIEEAGGSIRVASELGKGSTFEMSLPMTFGLLNAVLVSAAGQRYLVDAGHILSKESFAADHFEINKSDATISINNEHVPLLRLSDLLGQASDDAEGRSVVLCQFAQDMKSQFALLVDEIGETQQVLVRDLGSRGGRWFGVAGAAELNDGAVVLLLDLIRLINRTRRRMPSERIS